MRFVLLHGNKNMPYNVITMEQHPVPQNVTTFQFRLIGDMTIKQFGYIAGGMILAYISYRLPLPFFFTWPLAIIFALGGLGLAFVPIEERPMDVWVLSFIKSVYSPTKYVWSQEAKPAPVPQQTSVTTTRTPTPVSPPTGASPAKPAGERAMPDVVRGMFASVPGRHPGHVVTASARVNPWDWFMNLFSFSSLTRPAVPKSQPTGNFQTPSVVGKRMDVSVPPAVGRPKTAPGETFAEVQHKEEAGAGISPETIFGSGSYTCYPSR
jgi:hypothetical protein